MTGERSRGKTRSEFERGAAAGLRLARADRPLPHLHGGAYAVGLLFGYRSALRLSAHGQTSTLQPA